MNIFSIFTKTVMKAFFLVAVLVLSVSVASAQSTTSVLLHHVREANLVIKDRTNSCVTSVSNTLTPAFMADRHWHEGWGSIS